MTGYPRISVWALIRDFGLQGERYFRLEDSLRAAIAIKRPGPTVAHDSLLKAESVDLDRAADKVFSREALIPLVPAISHKRSAIGGTEINAY